MTASRRAIEWLHPTAPASETSAPDLTGEAWPRTPSRLCASSGELVVAYAKQEATEPLLGLRRYAALGLAGAVLMGTGIFFLAIGALRAMQQYGGWIVHGNWSWVPYFVVVIALIAIAALVWMARSRKQRRAERSKTS